MNSGIPQLGGLSLRRNFWWSAVGNIVYASCQWGIVAALAKIGSPEMVGQFALGLAIATPIALFFQFQLRGVQATDASGSFSFFEYLTLRLLTAGTALVITILVVLCSSVASSAVAVVMLIAADRALSSLADIFYGSYQQRERMDIIAKATMLNGILSLLLTVGGVWATGRLAIGLLGYLAGTSLSLFFYVVPKRIATVQDCRKRWVTQDWRRLWSLLVLAFPLGIVMMLVSLTSSIPRFAIERSFGTSELGVFAALTYLLVAGTTVVSALGQSASPRLAIYYASGDIGAFWLLTRRLIGMGAVVGAAGFMLVYLLGREIVSLFYTPEYSADQDVLEVLALGAGISFAASFAGYSMTAARRFTIQVPLFAAVVLVCATSSYLLVPKYGLVGAAWATAITGLVQLALSLQVLRHAISPRRRAESMR